MKKRDLPIITENIKDLIIDLGLLIVPIVIGAIGGGALGKCCFNNVFITVISALLGGFLGVFVGSVILTAYALKDEDEPY